MISFKDLLRVFFSVHDPTTLNRQGNDIGTQYRSAIFYHDEDQKRDAEEVINEITDEGIYENPIVTEVSRSRNSGPLRTIIRNTFAGIRFSPTAWLIVEPKVRKFRQKWADLLKSKRAD